MVLRASEKLGDILVQSGMITSGQLHEALEEQKETKKRLGIILCQKGLLKEEDIVRAFSNQLGVPYVDLSACEPDHVALRIIPQSLAKRYLTLPLLFENDTLSVVMSDPLDDHLLGAIKFATGKKIKTNVATTTDIRKAIIRFYDGTKVEQIGDILIKAKVINRQQLARALKKQETDNRKLGEILVADNVATEKDIVLAYSTQLGVPYKELKSVEPHQEALRFLPQGLAQLHLIVPLTIIRRVLVVSMADPLDIKAINAVAIATGMLMKIVISTPTEIHEAINRFYNVEKSQSLGEIPVASELADVKDKKHPPTGKKIMLGDVLLAAGLLKPDDIATALARQKETKKKLGDILVEDGYIKDVDLARAMSTQLGIPFIEMPDYNCQPEALRIIPEKLAIKYLAIPLSVERNLLYVATSDPLDREVIDALTFASGKKIRFKVSTATDIRKGIVHYYQKKGVKRLGDILLGAGLVTEQQLTDACNIQKGSTKKLGELLTEQGIVSEIDICKAFSTQLGIPFVDLTSATHDAKAIELISEGVALQHMLIPLRLVNRELTIVMANPLDVAGIKDIAHITGKQIMVTVSTPSMIKDALRRHYQYNSPLQEIEIRLDEPKIEAEIYHTSDELIHDSNSPPIIRIVDNILLQAVKVNASDIHLEPKHKTLDIRYRVDGMLRSINQLPGRVQRAVSSRLKIMAGLDISERRLPQDGRIKIEIDNKEVDLRVNTLPSQYGEKVVMRLLDSTSAILNVKDIGLSEKDSARLRGALSAPNGILLVTGPTGSGKSSTLYAIINHVKEPTINVMTLEDPIEYNVDGINQIAISERLTFAQGLRAALRQDPDIILVGEMRDSETANIAVQASITGHLVLSTLHTNSAVGAIARMVNMGVKPFMLASSLRGIVAQRLVRKICGKCRISYSPSSEELLKIGLNGTAKSKNFNFYKGAGCPICSKTGYKGRMGIFEIMTISQKMRNLIAREAPEYEIERAAVEAGMSLMYEDAINKVREGLTTIDEVARSIHVGDSNQEGDDRVSPCAKCGSMLYPDYVICPSCGTMRGDRCTGCGKPRLPDWQFCPYCTKNFAQLATR
ncbi:MAG: Flp pilus assembly complex ATPase component TadA [Nitrospirae bacterium]|nr:Flp pilus assembly complex ATPase component TadA [Nitrospirota bacterium]MBF0591113.1 Flp pilus assembly complex ATPase component TadA [Nitrospirota bacterium]